MIRVLATVLLNLRFTRPAAAQNFLPVGGEARSRMAILTIPKRLARAFPWNIALTTS